MLRVVSSAPDVCEVVVDAGDVTVANALRVACMQDVPGLNFDAIRVLEGGPFVDSALLEQAVRALPIGWHRHHTYDVDTNDVDVPPMDVVAVFEAVSRAPSAAPAWLTSRDFVCKSCTNKSATLVHYVSKQLEDAVQELGGGPDAATGFLVAPLPVDGSVLRIEATARVSTRRVSGTAWGFTVVEAAPISSAPDTARRLKIYTRGTVTPVAALRCALRAQLDKFNALC